MLVGELFARLGLQTDEYDKGIDKAKQGLDDVEQHAKGGGSRIGGFLGNALSFAAGGLITKGIEAIGGSFGFLKDAMIGGNAQFEQYQAQFTTLLKSAPAAQQRLKELADFGAKTPFELPEVVDADKILQGFGLHSEEAAKKFGFSGAQIRTIAGDVASGTGTKFDEMALLLGKFSAGATGEAISRFQELGITTRDELTKMGLKFSASGQLLSPLPESMNVVLGLMKDKYGGLMDVQSSTFGGMVSNLQDWVAGTLRTLGQPIFEVVKEKLGDLLSFLSAPSTMAALDALAHGLAVGIGGAMDFLSTVIIPALSTAFQALKPVFALVGQLFSGAGQQSGMLGTALNALGGVWTTFQGLVAAVVPAIRSVVLTVFGAVQDFLKAHSSEISAVLKLAWATIGDVVKLTVAIVKDAIIPAFKAIAAFIAAHKTEITTLLSAAWTIISAVITAALAIIRGVVQTALALLKGDWSGAWDAIKQMVATVWDSIKQLIGGALTLIKTELSLAWEAVKAVAGPAWDAIKSAITTPLTNAKTAISGTIDALKATLSGAWESIKSGARSAWDGIADAIGGAFGGITSKIDSVLSAVKRAINKAIDGFNTLSGAVGGPQIPKLAKGTRFFQGGIAMVGELGPELVYLPRGSQVVPHRETAAMLGGAGGGQTVVNNYNLTAQYGYQPERSLRDDVRMFQLLGGTL